MRKKKKKRVDTTEDNIDGEPSAKSKEVHNMLQNHQSEDENEESEELS